MRFIMVNHRFVTIHHDDSSWWRIAMHHHAESWWPSWGIMMNHRDASWWLIMMSDTHSSSCWGMRSRQDETWWPIIVNHVHHYEAPCGPERIPFRRFMAFLPWTPGQSKASFCHGCLFATAPTLLFHTFFGSCGICPWRDLQNGKAKQPGDSTKTAKLG